MTKRLLVDAPSLTDEQDKAFREAVLTGKARVSRRRFMALLGLTPAMAMAQTWQPLATTSGAPLTWQKLETENCSPGTWCKVIKPPFRATITTHQQELNLAAWAAANGWDGSEPAEITIAPGVYIWSDNTAVAGLTTGVFPGGLSIINQGCIIGKGGTGGSFNLSGLVAPTAGGPALSLSCACAIDNKGYIAGGGGGGAAAGEYYAMAGGGGAGGGPGGYYYTGRYTYTGGAGGAIGASGGAGDRQVGGGGGGRVLPGTGGSTRSVGGGAGGGGTGGAYMEGDSWSIWWSSYYSGGGGGWGAAGGAGRSARGGSSPVTQTASATGGSANTKGADGPYVYSSNQRSTPGAAGGNAVKRNGYAITWIAMGTVWGAVS